MTDTATDLDGLDLDRLAELITREMAAGERCRLASEAADDPGERSRLYWQGRYARNRADAAQLRAAELFGRVRGWHLTPRDFNLRTLSRGGMHDGRWASEHSAGHYHHVVDHPQYYRVNRYAAAIVAHNYNPDITAAAELARSYGLTLETLDAPSWYLPGGTRLVVYVGPRGVAR